MGLSALVSAMGLEGAAECIQYDGGSRVLFLVNLQYDERDKVCLTTPQTRVESVVNTS
jgi:hypothetical protein